MYLASANGGHIDLLCRLGDALSEHPRVWVTQESGHVKRLRAEGERLLLLPAWSRDLVKGRILTNIWRSAYMVLRERPRVVLTTGSGLVVAFCVFARLAGAHVVFVETSARITNASRAGRVLHRIAHHTLVQWPSMTTVYEGSVCCKPSILAEIAASPCEPGVGTAVTVGTMIQPFDRLLRAVDDAIERGVLHPPVIAQGGVSPLRPTHYEVRPWLTPAEIDDAMASAEVVVCHAGSGSISAALRYGRRPLVMARRAGTEHFDDHQDQLLRELTRMDLVVPITSTIDASHIASSKRPIVAENAPVQALQPTLSACLRGILPGLLERSA